IAAAFVLLAGAALWWTTRNPGKMEVKLVFLGYTNSAVETNSSFKFPARAVIMATNIGGATIELFPHTEKPWLDLNPDSELEMQGFEPTAGSYFPARLRPGETCFFEVTQESFRRPWRLKIPVVYRSW